MQTILGSGGVIGTELAKFLQEFTNEIRLVSRNPQKVNAGDSLFSADLTKVDEVLKAVEGSEIVYLTAGFTYNIKVWQKIWPLVMENVIKACKVHKAKLVFFDNIYMYDPNFLNPATEETPINPSSKKGAVRAHIAQLLLDEIDSGEIKALIARSADFYGPGIKGRSVLTETVFNNLSKGKKANWMASVDYVHSYTYVPDAAKATAILGNTAEAYNQVWHLPTAANPLTGIEWIESIAKEMSKKPNYIILRKGFLMFLGLFIQVMKEMYEMVYQYDRHYHFDSTKFIEYFKFEPTSYADGIKEIVKKDYS